MSAEKILILSSLPELGVKLEQSILQPAGYTVTFVAELNVAQDLLKQTTYDLIILGEHIGTQSGLELGDCLASQYPALPLILVGQNDAVLSALRSGFWDFLPLPLEPAQVLKVVEQALARAQRIRDWVNSEGRKVNRKLQRSVEILESLHRIGRSVTGYLELDSILTTVVDAAVDMTSAEEGSLLLLDEGTGELYMRAARNFQDDFVRKFRLPIRDSLPGQVLRSGKPLTINADTPQKIKTSYLVHTLLYVPLIVHSRVIGVLGVDNRQSGRPFQEEHLSLVTTLADYAAIAIENARAYTVSDAERKKLETVLTRVEDGVIVVDQDNRLVLANQTACSAFNTVPGNLQGRKVSDVFPHPELMEIFENTKTHPSRTEITLEDGRVFNAQVTPISEVGTVVTMQDITHLKELDRIKSDFVSTVSHDLRSPLTAILGYVDLIERAGPISEQQMEFIQRIQYSVNNITALINDMLDLGRIEAGFDARKEIVSLPAVINFIVEDMHLALEKKQQHLSVEMAADLPEVLGNPTRLRQMISNLVVNALKFSPPGQTVTVRLNAEENQLIIQVQDRGPGIPPADQPYIFNKFYRASNISQDTPGLGLGLSIVKTIVENHGGRIWVESTMGDGSTFTIVLPVAQT